jgi:hypothetical protein
MYSSEWDAYRLMFVYLCPPGSLSLSRGLSTYADDRTTLQPSWASDDVVSFVEPTPPR